MEAKKLDQFMVDYYRNSDTIEVQCNWLQEQLRQKHEAELKVAALERAMQMLLRQNTYSRPRPRYVLDERI